MRTLATRIRREAAGSTAVEFALIFPIVVLLTLGIIEFGFVIRDQVATVNLVRDASRTASAYPRVGTISGHAGPNPSDDSQIPSFAYLASQAVKNGESGLPKNSIVDFTVYLANTAGYPTHSASWQTDSNRTMTCTDLSYCVQYRWVDGTPGYFEHSSGDWDPAKINACPSSIDPGKGQAVGVYLRIEHQGLFNGLFHSTLTLSDHNVVKFEPMIADACGQGL